ncbi:hypothetical protein PF005_g30864 [Phytophthora fragariae]|uniref:Uncharacterized protein n=1 Tax=Phytophthora fragariae TaxID=53985 RepID=A0A6A3VK42_9STRA|nr:hypothetical protein PF009_g31041 [Phytophthora fragariae]KAE8960275.1 hypothetical protein PF011_g30153 [Phytophthora fragariae]KAE9059526.1 hypothetical protein PF010_g30582 [Phytophthora fragariae]KAE9065106.1 hypothetical protein PF006_g30535 [Phytophthora fragariae]KAE9162393.1 hypothetical protein PF005_g30864 [Phytophthora fragariae]
MLWGLDSLADFLVLGAGLLGSPTDERVDNAIVALGASIH